MKESDLMILEEKKGKIKKEVEERINNNKRSISSSSQNRTKFFK